MITFPHMNKFLLSISFFLPLSLPTDGFTAPFQCRTNIVESNSFILKHKNNLHSSRVQEDEFHNPKKEYLVTCIPGLAPYLEDELISCGATETEILSKAAVSFTTDDMAVPLKCLVWSRTAHRLLELIDSFEDIESRDDVYNAVQQMSGIHIKDLLGDGDGGLLSLSVKVIVNGRMPKDISHTHYTALTIKNALVDQVRALKDGERPNVDIDDPDVPLVAIFHSNGRTVDMSLYRSLSPPGSLHRRGYRSGGAIHKAAMKESLAAGLLLAADWPNHIKRLRSTDSRESEASEKKLTLVDPMCGSGSLLLEAAMMAVDFSPGLMRIMNQIPGSKLPPVLRWKGNRDNLLPIWKKLLTESSEILKAGLSWMKENEGKIEILGNDIHPGALDLVESSLKQAGGLDGIVRLHYNNCCEWDLMNGKERDHNQILVMTNPPWGVRLNDDDHESWEALRTFLREKCPPGRTEAWVLSGNKSATKHLGLRRSQSVSLQTGQQDLRWIQYIMLDRPASSGANHNEDRQATAKTRLPAHINPERIIRNRPIPMKSAEPTSTSRAPAKTRRQSLSRQERKVSPSRSRDNDSWI